MPDDASLTVSADNEVRLGAWRLVGQDLEHRNTKRLGDPLKCLQARGRGPAFQLANHTRLTPLRAESTRTLRPCSRRSRRSCSPSMRLPRQRRVAGLRRHQLQPAARGPSPRQPHLGQGPRRHHVPRPHRPRRPHRLPRPRRDHLPPARRLASPGRRLNLFEARRAAACCCGLTRPDPVTAPPKVPAAAGRRKQASHQDIPQKSERPGKQARANPKITFA